MTAERKETEHRNTRRDYHFERLLGEKLSRRQVEAWKLSSGVTQWMVEAMESSCEIEFELSHRVFGVLLSCDKVELEAGELSRGRLEFHSWLMSISVGATTVTQLRLSAHQVELKTSN